MMDSSKFHDKLYRILYDYLLADDCYVYELTRVKTSPCISLEDFEEWNEEDIEDLATYIVTHWNEVE